MVHIGDNFYSDYKIPIEKELRHYIIRVFGQKY